MSEREDVEALAEVLRNEGFWATHADRWTDVAWQNRFWTALGGAVLASPWLATHDEQVRAEALAPVRALVEHGWRSGIDFDPRAREALRAALPSERLAGEVGAE